MNEQLGQYDNARAGAISRASERSLGTGIHDHRGRVMEDANPTLLRLESEGQVRTSMRPRSAGAGRTRALELRSTSESSADVLSLSTRRDFPDIAIEKRVIAEPLKSRTRVLVPAVLGPHRIGPRRGDQRSVGSTRAAPDAATVR